MKKRGERPVLSKSERKNNFTFDSLLFEWRKYLFYNLTLFFFKLKENIYVFVILTFTKTFLHHFITH